MRDLNLTGSEDVRARASRIRLLALDVDGVLCEPLLEYTASGEEIKRFHVRDGMAIRLLIESGIEVAIVTARASEPLRRRVLDLGIEHAHFECRDKLSALRGLAGRLGIELSEVCFVGDDLFDVPALRAVGLPVCVADAHAVAKQEAAWQTPSAGGHGAVREVADLLLGCRADLQRTYEAHLERQIERTVELRPEPASAGFGVIIPARYGSVRLPGKPLLEIAGEPMIVHVYRNASRSGANFVIVATDDPRIAEVVRAAGGEALLTSPEHSTGTDRLAEVVERRRLPSDFVVVNVQGDEPFVDPEAVKTVARALERDREAGIATLATPIRAPVSLFDPNVVKVALGRNGRALYFSRAPIPWDRERFSAAGGSRNGQPLRLDARPYLRHIGLYAYRVRTLRQLAAEKPTELERAESLEQLRALWLGIGIRVEVVDEAPAHGVDTVEDLRRVETLMAQGADARAESPSSMPPSSREVMEA